MLLNNIITEKKEFLLIVKSIKRKMLKNKSSKLVATFKEYKLLACLYS